MKADVYQIITDRIIEKLEQGIVPWRKPWRTDLEQPRNLITNKPYQGINSFLLACTPFASSYWLTFKQAQSLKGSIKKGEKGTPIVFWNFIEKPTESTGIKEKIPYLKYYTVFNVEQTEGIAIPKEETQTHFNNPIEEAESIIKNIVNPPKFKNASSAYYSPLYDEVAVPNIKYFNSVAEYYSALFHELGHSTGHESRLKRKLDTTFASHAYSKEELIAEMTSCFLMSEVGLINETIDNSTAYLQSWIKKLKNDKKLLIQAGGQAQKATNYILNKEVA